MMIAAPSGVFDSPVGVEAGERNLLRPLSVRALGKEAGGVAGEETQVAPTCS